MELSKKYDELLIKGNSILEWDNVRYIPKPNTVITRITDDMPPLSLTPTSFSIPFYKDNIVLAHNVRRGMEFPGGHIEENETIEESTLRELIEETGTVGSITSLLCVRRHESFAEKPEHYDYEFPVTYMPFFIVEVESFENYEENDECKKPFILPIVNGEVNFTGYEKEWERFISVYESDILIKEAIKKRRV